jgi:hypothetical protein
MQHLLCSCRVYQNGRDLGRPLERPEAPIVVRDAVLDGGDQVRNAPEHAVAVTLGRELAEPPLDEIQPGGTGRSAGEMEAWGARESVVDAGMLADELIRALGRIGRTGPRPAPQSSRLGVGSAPSPAVPGTLLGAAEATGTPPKRSGGALAPTPLGGVIDCRGRCSRSLTSRIPRLAVRGSLLRRCGVRSSFYPLLPLPVPQPSTIGSLARIIHEFS